MNHSELLSRYADNTVAATLGIPAGRIAHALVLWGRPHRHYHGMSHLADILGRLAAGGLPRREREILELVALYHDAVYIPGRSDNEEQSAALFLADATKPGDDAELIAGIILDTTLRSPAVGLSAEFRSLDMHVKTHGSFADAFGYERGIFLEFQQWSFPEYRHKRIAFLEELARRVPEAARNAAFLSEVLTTARPRIGIYPGTFAPFHTGHLSILEKAERLFDKVVVAIGINPDKDAREPVTRLAEVQRLLPFHEVITFTGFLTDLTRRYEEYADITVIRGLRNGNDLDYEVNQLRFMEELYPKISTMYLVCDKQFEHISSSAIRNLSKIDPAFASRYTPDKYAYHQQESQQ